MSSHVLINDQPFDCPETQTLQHLLERFGAEPPYVVALNRQLVPRSCYADQTVSAGDRIEVLQPIQGG